MKLVEMKTSFRVSAAADPLITFELSQKDSSISTISRFCHCGPSELHQCRHLVDIVVNYTLGIPAVMNGNV